MENVITENLPKAKVKERIAYFDNAKFILIFFVVLGHQIIRLSPNDRFESSLCTWIFTFHMPAFAIISGYFSKNIACTYKKRILNYIILYVFFEILYAPISKAWGIFFIFPYYTLWYLICLIFWSIALLQISKIKHQRFVLLALIICGMIAGYFPLGKMLSLERFFVFFPFFFLGYLLSKHSFDRINKLPIKFIAVLILSLAFILLLNLHISFRWFEGYESYSFFGKIKWYSWAYRLGIYMVSGLMCFCFFAIVPRKKYLWTYLGSNTLYTFLFHEYINTSLKTFWLIDGFKFNLFVMLPLSFFISVSFSTNVIKRSFNLIINPFRSACISAFYAIRNNKSRLISKKIP